MYAHPTSGIHIHIDTASDVTLRNCEVVWAGTDPLFAHAVEAVDVEDLVIKNLRGAAARPDLDPVLIRRRGPGEVRYPVAVDMPVMRAAGD